MGLIKEFTKDCGDDNNSELCDEQGFILRKIRSSLKMTQEEFGKATNISVGYISLMESGKKNISLKSKIVILKVLQEVSKTVSFSWLEAIKEELGEDFVSDINIFFSDNDVFESTTDAEPSEIKKIMMDYFNVMFGNLQQEHQNCIKLKKITPQSERDEYDEESNPIYLNDNEYETYSNHKSLLKNLHRALKQNSKYQYDLDYILDSTLSDVNAFFRDIEIIKPRDLDANIERMATSLKRQLRKAYYDINKEVYILGQAGAGDPIDAFDFRDIIPVPNNIKGMDFALKIKGDSMMPSYQDGQVIFVKSQVELNNGELGIFDLGFSKHVFKKYYKEQDVIRLKSLNKSYDDIIITEDNGRNFKIVGKVL